MAVIVTVGSNSWITRIEADDYFAEKWGAVAWASLTALEKDQLIITAYRWINQKLNLSIPAASTATKVKHAQCEAAWFVYEYWTEYSKRRALAASGVKSFDISNWSETLNSVQFPAYILGMVEEFIINDGGYFPTVSRSLNE